MLVIWLCRVNPHLCARRHSSKLRRPTPSGRQTPALLPAPRSEGPTTSSAPTPEGVPPSVGTLLAASQWVGSLAGSAPAPTPPAHRWETRGRAAGPSRWRKGAAAARTGGGPCRGRGRLPSCRSPAPLCRYTAVHAFSPRSIATSFKLAFFGADALQHRCNWMGRHPRSLT